MLPTEVPPVRRIRYATSDVEEATEVLRARYADHVPSFSGPRDDLVFEVESAEVSTSCGRLSVDRVRHSMRVSARVEPFPATSVVVPVSGRVGFRCGREQAVDGPLLAPGWAGFHSSWDDVDVGVATVDSDGLRQVGAEMSGLAPAAVSFTGMTPCSPELGRFVAATVAHHERHALSNDEAMTSLLVRAQLFRELATTLLVAFPNTTHTLDRPRGGGRAESAAVRRAVEFIDANAHRDIGLTQIAEAARVGVRGLQHGFRRHRDTTPLAYVKRVRLERAHGELQAADPLAGDTVSAIAVRWGFLHAGAFSADYRRAYGRPPSHTLRG